MKNLISYIKKRKAIFGMVHVQALPGTPRCKMSIDEISEIALEEALTYAEDNLDGIVLENMHDIPYLNRRVGPEITASMTAIAQVIKANISIPVGVQILAGANKEALAVARATGLDFIRAEGFLYSHIADEGQMDSDAGELLRYRKQIGAEAVQIFTDIKKKHSSHTLTSDLSISEYANAAEFFLSDGIIVTGSSTGSKPDLTEIKQAGKETDLPLLVGSGINRDNIEMYWEHVDGFIVGSHFKKSGNWKNELSQKRIRDFMDKVVELRK